jgi:hypothetical protein
VASIAYNFIWDGLEIVRQRPKRDAVVARYDQLREITDADWLKITPADVGYWLKTSTAMSALMSAIL